MDPLRCLTGSLELTRTCARGHSTRSLEPFQTLSLFFPAPNATEVRLEELLQARFKPETLSCACEQCGPGTQESQQASAVLDAPIYLLLHLVRFAGSGAGPEDGKIETTVQYPTSLELSASAAYELQGVVVHRGTLAAGHYLVKAQQRGKWYQFNDVSVSQLAEPTPDPGAYLLLYQKK